MKTADTFRAYQGRLQIRKYGEYDWNDIGEIIHFIPVTFEREDVTAILYVNMHDNQRDSYIFVQRGHECSRFGWVFYKCKTRRVDKHTCMVKECRAKFGQKIRLKDVKLGNGEGVSEYSLRSAGIKAEHLKKEYDFDKVELAKAQLFKNKTERERAQLEFDKKKEHELALRKRIEKKEAGIVEVNTAKIRTSIPYQSAPIKNHKFEIFIQSNAPQVIRATAGVKPEKRYVLINRTQVVEVE